MGHIAFCYDVTSVRAYRVLVTTFSPITNSSLHKEVELWYATYLNLNFQVCARVATGSCPGIGLEGLGHLYTLDICLVQMYYVMALSGYLSAHPSICPA